MNDTTKRFQRNTSEAFDNERYFSGYHSTSKDYWFLKKKTPWTTIVLLCVLAVLLSIGIIKQGISALDEAQAVEQARQDAINQAQAEKRKQAGLQEMCGGPEATPVDLGGGMYDCVNKRGFKQRVK